MAALLSLLCGCLAAETPIAPPMQGIDAGTPDAGFAPADAGPDEPPPPIDVSAQRVMTEAVEFVGALPGGALIVQTSSAVVHLPGPGASPVDITGDAGALRAVVPLEWGRILLAGDLGFFLVEEGALVESPLGMAYRADAVRQVVSAPGPAGSFDLWVALQDSLHLWRAGRSFTLRPGALPVAGAILAWGAPIDGVPAAWVAAGDAVYGIAATGDSFTAHQALSGVSVDAMTVDHEGRLWIATGGVLKSRGWDGVWYRHDDVPPVSALAAHRDAYDLWIVTSEGLWHHARGAFQPVRGAPDAASIRRIDATPSGHALVVDDGGLELLIAGHAVSVTGLAQGSLLDAPATVEIVPEAPEHVTMVSATLDGAPVTVESSPWRVALDPAALDQGTHELALTVQYGDGAPDSRLSLRFSVFHQAPPSWSKDIKPLFDARCALCHGAQGSARRLDTPASWRNEIDRIVAAINDGRMPLPPNPSLRADEIELIEGWRAAGFLE